MTVLQDTIALNFTEIQAQMAPYPDAKLVAVSKYASLDQIEAAYHCGLRRFGESKIQDLMAKQTQLLERGCTEIEWHFIGHFQSNKVNKTRPSNLVAPIALIESVDSLALAEKLNRAYEEEGHVQDILLQVNVVKDPNKSGFEVDELVKQYESLLSLKNLKTKGLMTIGPYPVDLVQSAQCFSQLNMLKARLDHDFGHLLTELSMGMSADYVVALENGATIIRVGRRLFGDVT